MDKSVVSSVSAKGWAMAGILAVATVISLMVFADWHLWRPGLWYDESIQFWAAMGGDGFDAPLTPRGPLSLALQSNAKGNLDPGGFTLLLRFWMMLTDEAAVWQRALPLVFLIAGMVALGLLGWTWRKSVPFAFACGLVPVCSSLLLDYATEIRAYSMEFAGVCIGALVIARLIERPTLARALLAGTVYGAFVSSRYSYVLFTAATCVCLVFVALTWRGEDRRALVGPAVAFATPLLALGSLIFVVSVRLQIVLRITYDDGAHLRYLDHLTTVGRSAGDLLVAAAGNLLSPHGLPATALAAIGVVALVGALFRGSRGTPWLQTQTAAFGVLSLATLAVTALAWPWHPWSINEKWSLYLQALSAIAVVRLAASVLSYRSAPGRDGLETDRRIGALLVVAVLVLDTRFAMHRRPEGNSLIGALEYLETNARQPGDVAILGLWYPTVRFFYEFGRFRGSRIYPSHFVTGNSAYDGAAVGAQTRFLLSSMPQQAVRTIVPGIQFIEDPSLPPNLFRIAMPAAQPGDEPQ